MSDQVRQVGNFAALLRASQTAQPNGEGSVEQKRSRVAELCRMLGPHLERSAPHRDTIVATESGPLSPRLSQTLEALLAGDSEKQIALKLAISQHTVHVYVKALYKEFAVSSRGELLSRFITKETRLQRSSARAQTLAVQ